MLPSSISASGSIISVPVGKIATSGFFTTSIFNMPAERSTPISIGLILWLLGSIISPATISSPIGLICCHELADAMIFTPSSVSTISSAMITASQGGCIGSPVSTMTYWSSLRITGFVSVAALVSAAFTAMPSIADALKRGELYFAYTAFAVTLSRLCVTSIVSYFTSTILLTADRYFSFASSTGIVCR